jgi:DNA replication protein DnaC
VPGSFEISVSECECAVKRRNALRIKRSGLADIMSRYTFEAYKTPDKQTAAIKAAALRYVAESRGEWFVIVGRPGSGKTHICTAIVGKLIEGGKNCKYMLWRDEVRELKALVNDNPAYRERMNLLKNVDVLYIDDFFKGRTVSDGDLNVAFELLNARYNARKRTIISGERTIGAIMDIDEAIGSRIYERSKNGYCFETSPENWRLT